MLFSGITFLYYFLPAALLIYFVVPHKFKNAVLFLFSLIFYAYGEIKYVFLMLIFIGTGYLSGILMEKLPKKPVMLISVAFCLGLLIYYKYADFVIVNINGVFKKELPLLKVVLPIGISFYTFQIISYILDVYYENKECQKNFLYLATYISMFPQLIAGPIVRYADIKEMLWKRSYTIKQAAEGIRRFILGLFKKVYLSNRLGELCGIFRNSQEQTIAFYWLYAVSATLQIYFDFSGYSDMAIGLGKILGFSFPENFDYPYMSKSITEFWRRWHISLGTWFRDYVYIPLGGNKKGKIRQIFNIVCVWFLTGLWHGAQWNFILWGIYFALLLIVEKLGMYDVLKKSKVLGHFYTLFFVIISFVMFDANTMGEAFDDLKHMFFVKNNRIYGEEFLYYLKSYGWILLMAVFGATDFPKKIYQYLEKRCFVKKVLMAAEPFFYLILLLICTAYLVDGSFNPFLYFRF